MQRTLEEVWPGDRFSLAEESAVFLDLPLGGAAVLDAVQWTLPSGQGLAQSAKPP